MDDLLKVALAGTLRSGGAPPTATTPTDALVPAEGDHGAERRVLLLAGARAIYRQAGLAPRAVPAPERAPDDPLPSCSPGAAQLLARLLGGEQVEIVPEALERLRRAGLRLPHPLLPAALALGSDNSALRPALAASIGARGRWLARQHPGWLWAADLPLDRQDGIPAEVAEQWEGGRPAQRLAILRRVREHDPALARDWLAAVWKAEKAEFRGDALAVLEAGLSLGDEPFLEAALDDRGAGVRARAAELLGRLPGSALATRLRERADQLLTFTPGLLAGGWRSAAKALVKGSSGGKLTANPPESFDKAWARDGIAAKPPQGFGARAWWLVQIIEAVPPRHWSERFAAPLPTLLDAAGEGEWGEAIIEGWARAAMAFGDAEWAIAIWVWWLNGRSTTYGRRIATALRSAPEGSLPEEDLRAIIARLLPPGADSSDDRWITILDIPPALPSSWDAAFGRCYLDALADKLARLIDDPREAHDTWLRSIPVAALALPHECLVQARNVAMLQLPDDANWHLRSWRRAIEGFNDATQLRSRLMEEIPL